MDLKLLGPLEIVPQIRGAELRRAKEHSILAVLALAPGQAVATETLITRVWDDDAPSDTVKRTMRTYVRNVKGAVAAAGGARVESVRGGYALRIDRENVDVHRFRRLVRQAEAISGRGDTERAVSLLREAEGLWRDQALAGLPGRWIESIRHGLHEERRLATERRVAHELSLGLDAELISELWRLAGQHPLDETWVGYQMQVLYRTGREVDALALYQQDYKRRVQVGLGPSPDLAALEARILGRDPSLKSRSADHRSARRVPWNAGLPPRPDVFVGRDRELAVLCESPATGAPAVKIIHGMGGCGKTSLVIEAVHRLRSEYPDPPVFLSFCAYEPGRVPLEARDALRQLIETVSTNPKPAPQTSDALAAMWQREAADRRSVIVFDDVPDTSVIAQVLPANGESIVFVTSRHRLTGLDGAVAIALGELMPDDAITLFTQTAGSSKIDDPAVLSRAAQLCGYLPLALKLSADRLRDQGTMLSDFVANVEERRVFSDYASTTIPGLMQTFELSYNGLDARHREFFRRLGTNPCTDFSPATAAVLVDSTVEEAESAIGLLCGRHLIEGSAGNRYHIHDLLREYAIFVAGRDDPRWERRRALHRLLDRYLHSACSADRALFPYRKRVNVGPPGIPIAQTDSMPVDDARQWLELEWRNAALLACYAAQHEWKQYCVDLSSAIAEFLDSRGCWSEAVDIHRTALRASRDLGDSLRLARAASDLSLPELRVGNYDDALLHVGEAADIFRSADDARNVAASLDRMGAIFRFKGQAREALAYHQEALEIYRNARNDRGVADAICNSGAAYIDLGRYSEAITHYQRALSLYQKIGYLRGEALCFNNIGDAMCQLGLYRDAMPNLEKALELYRMTGAKQNLALVILNMGHVAQSKGQYQEAIVSYRQALSICREMGDLRHLAGAFCDIGTAYQLQELHDQALIHYRESDVIAKEIGDLGVQSVASLGIADALSGSGIYSEALERYGITLELALRTENILLKAKVLEGIAETRFRMRDLATARICLREALDAYRVAGVGEAERVGLRLAMLNIKR
jgi:tetratricopeptide (TPR) repeat protein/DNA-binding SARP family transcriptional activator